MALQRECLAFVPTIPSGGGPTLWFEEPLEKTEDEGQSISDTEPGNLFFAPNVDAVANRHYLSVGFDISGTPDNGGWQADERLYVAAWTNPINGVVQPEALEEEGRVGDGITELEDIISTPADPAVTQSVAVEWRNSFGSPGFVESHEVTGNQIDITVPWTIPAP